MAKLKEGGIRFLGYINPFLAVDGRLYPEARDRGLCVKKADGSDYLTVTTSFPAAMLDLTKPEAVEWIKGVIRDRMIGAGLSGWMADFGEYLPTDAVLASGEDAELVHDEYPVLWARVNEEAVREAGAAGEVLWFCRSGYIGALSTARHAASIWAGDQMVDWSRDDGIPSVIPAALSLGLCGAPFSHADLGGYTTVGWVKRSRELLLRWSELSAFTPIMRSHEGNRPASNAQAWDDAETAAHVARMARIHSALAPYVRSLAREYEADGLPLMRPLFLHHPDDPRCANLKDEYLYGPDLLVAPVLRRGASRRRVYIPAGDWLGLWDGKPVFPGRRVVPAPLGRPPVFYRAGSPWAALFAGLARA
jgi:alpha-glucosidase